MTNFPRLKVITLCLMIAVYALSGCAKVTSDPTTIPITTVPTASSIPSTAAPVTNVVITHPELELITPYNTEHIEQIDQWGQGNVNGVALSPDGTLIAVSTTTGIYLYDRNTARQTDYIDIRIGNDIEPQACSPTGNIAFSPDGSTLAIANTDIKLWDIKSRTTRGIINNKVEDPASHITEIQFSLDGTRIFGVQKRASGYPCYTGWGSLVIYALDTGELIFRSDYSRYEEGPETIFHEKNGTVFIAYIGANKKGRTILKVDLRTGIIKKEIPSPDVYSINNTGALIYKWISEGGNGGGYSQTRIVDLDSFKDIEILRADATLIPHSDNIIIREKQALTVRTIEGEVTCSKPINSETIPPFLPIMFSLDGTVGISWNSHGFRAGDIRVWDLKECTISEPILTFPEVARKLSISPDGRSVITSSIAGYTFHVFDTKTGKMRFSLSGYDAEFSADGKQVFVVNDDALNAYDVETGKYLYPVLKDDFDYMTSVMVSPNGKFLAINDTSTREYRVTSLDKNSSMGEIPDLLASELHFSRNGKFMAEIKDGEGVSELRFWDLSNGSELIQQRGLLPRQGYTEPTFNSDFSQLVTLDTDGYYKLAYLWNVQKLSLVNVFSQPFLKQKRPINNLEIISGDRLLFAHGSTPDVFLFWNVQTGDLLSEVPVEIRHSEFGNPIAFSSDERLILALDGDGTIHVWGIK